MIAQEIMTFLQLEALIVRLVENNPHNTPHNTLHIPENHIKFICNTAKSIFLSQPILLELKAPIKVVGDIHGQFTDLLRIFKRCGYPPLNNYLFLGDYVDRGKQSVQTMVLLLCYKIKYSQNFFLLRGNHESRDINVQYGFYDECKRKYSTKIWKIFVDCFNTMPIAAVIERRIFCVHGGISKQLKDFRTINTIKRPTDVTHKGILSDLLWSDPDEQQTGWRENINRRVGWLFGASVLGQFLQANDLQLICRSHQVIEEGYQFFAKKQLVTIFSAPNYCGQFNNCGAVLNIGEQLVCSFEIIKPHLCVQKKKWSKRSKWFT